jgi:HPt (histidine-containing phosphotransfer) domain-containing protein
MTESELQKSALASGPLDEKIISDLRAEGENLFQDLIKLFLTEAPANVQEIRTAVSENDFETIALSAHRLKGSAFTFGAFKLGELCQRLEMAGKAGEFAKVESLFNQLMPECSRVSAALKGEQKDC